VRNWHVTKAKADSINSHFPLCNRSYAGTSVVTYQSFKIFIIFTSTNTADRIMLLLLFDLKASADILQVHIPIAPLKQSGKAQTQSE
jgi:hypothetical protein